MNLEKNEVGFYENDVHNFQQLTATLNFMLVATKGTTLEDDENLLKSLQKQLKHQEHNTRKLQRKAAEVENLAKINHQVREIH